jgi:hypothetical protein
MRRLAWGAAFGLLGLLGLAPGARAIHTLYGAKADSRDVLLGGRYAVPASGQSFVKVLTTYSPSPKKR